MVQQQERVFGVRISEFESRHSHLTLKQITSSIWASVSSSIKYTHWYILFKLVVRVRSNLLHDILHLVSLIGNLRNKYLL